MSKSKVVVVLTPLEAEQLEFAVTNTLHDPAEWKDYLNDRRKFNACMRAFVKLCKAIREEES